MEKEIYKKNLRKVSQVTKWIFVVSLQVGTVAWEKT